MTDFREQLETLCADIVSLRRSEPVMRRLFRVGMAEWRSAAHLCDGLPELAAAIAELERRTGDSLRVMWVDRPWGEVADHCLVIFYLEGMISGFFAIYNHGRLALQLSYREPEQVALVG
jgi:hypothetical protein